MDLCLDHVPDRDDRKIDPVSFTGCRVDRCRAARAHAATNDVRADHKEAVGVDRAPGADQQLPPARFAGFRMDVRAVLVAGQGMADQDGVRLVRIEFTVGLIGDPEGAQNLTTLELQTRTVGEIHHRTGRVIGLVEAGTVDGFKLG